MAKFKCVNLHNDRMSPNTREQHGSRTDIDPAINIKIFSFVS